MWICSLLLQDASSVCPFVENRQIQAALRLLRNWCVLAQLKGKEESIQSRPLPNCQASFCVPRATYTLPAHALVSQKPVLGPLLRAPHCIALSKSLATSGSASLSDHELGWLLPLRAGREASTSGFPHWQLPWLWSSGLARLPAFLLTGSSVRSLPHTRHFKFRPNRFGLEAPTRQSSMDKTFWVRKRPGPFDLLERKIRHKKGMSILQC